MEYLLKKAFEVDSMQEGLDFFYPYLQKNYQVNYFKLYLLTPNRSFLSPRYLYGTKMNLGPISLHEEKSLVISCYNKNKEIFIPSIANSSYSRNKLFIRQNIQSFFAVPFMNQGVLTIEFSREVTLEEVEPLLILCKTWVIVLLNRFYNKLMREDVKKSFEEMQGEIAFSQKLSALGQLASSLAHEIKNPLATINMLIHQLLEDINPETLVFEDLQVIKEEIERINRLLAQFLDFAKPKKPDFKEINLNPVLQNIFHVIKGHLKSKTIEVNFYLQDNSVIQADKDQLQQILLNLLLNAVEVVPPKTGRINLSGEKTTKYGSKYYVLRIEDNGDGIPQDKLKSVFEPFFSEKGKGTGLGLSIVHRLVENHGGFIEAYNMLQGGACFSVYFPVQ